MSWREFIDLIWVSVFLRFKIKHWWGLQTELSQWTWLILILEIIYQKFSTLQLGKHDVSLESEGTSFVNFKEECDMVYYHVER